MAAGLKVPFLSKTSSYAGHYSVKDMHCYLGGVIGTPAFEQLFLRCNMDGWIDDLKTLSLFTQTQPHASYAAFCHGLFFRWNYFFRVSSCSTDLFLPLEHF